MRLITFTPLAARAAQAARAITPSTLLPEARPSADAERVAALYDELFPALYAYVRFRLGDSYLAEDVTSRVFERALGRIASLRSPDRVRAWLFAIARNLIADARRQQKIVLSLDAVDGDPSSWTAPPDDDVFSREQRDLLLASVSCLDHRARDLIGLRYAAGLRNRDIAAATGLSEANVAQILRRTLMKLRLLMQSDDAQEGGAP